ncbi:hypothetical protein FM106_06445 [Brachybacterium faecium]|nr:hypothetical protein FM106_06445 [Brachybacterium faecium]
MDTPLLYILVRHSIERFLKSITYQYFHNDYKKPYKKTLA